jgi:sugar/nucleoside kinase (ribokinase family)
MDILGIGNALLDIFWFSEDESALSLGLHPNHASHVTPARLDEILLAVPNPIYVSGGSASNAVKAAASLGLNVSFIGCLGTEDRERDQWANLFEADLSAAGVHCRFEQKNRPTGRCLVIWMPGAMKSIACAPSAATGLRAEDIDPALVAQAKLILLDGQVLRNGEVANHIAILARTHGIPLAIDMASADIATAYTDTLAELIEKNKLILLMNADEAEAFARAIEPSLGSLRKHDAPNDRGTERTDDAAAEIFPAITAKDSYFPCFVEKRAALGARAWSAGRQYVAETERVDAVLDDTGAGDVFDGAFLSAFLRGSDIPGALAFANRMARGTLQVPGTRLDPDEIRIARECLP